MENCVFIDIFTTGNDLYGKNNCPIQFCCEIFNETEIHDKEKFLNNPVRRKTVNIVPDEDILIPGWLNSGIRNEDVKNPGYDGVDLKTALENIYRILDTLNKKNCYLVGYNHIHYDMEILNRNFKRILDLEPIVFPDDRVIDVMKMAENRIPVNEIGNYTMESVFCYLYGNPDEYSRLKLRKSAETDILITKMIFGKFIFGGDRFSDVVKIENEPKHTDILNFGKYKGAKISEINHIDPSYLSWILNNKDINTRNPGLIESIKTEMNRI